jgi:alkanesulfonate monooxygenase SsuD/methylene tetrahydromethanopterin reductase-like flavin-dependent oxidoreductase (luciferase family)
VKVILFDLLPYGENLDHLKVDGKLPRPLGQRHFKPEVMARTYAEHLDVWEEMDRLGFDGVGFNEHHGTPYGSMNSPNLLAAAVSQRTQKLKILIYANLLPIHEPLRLAEEIAMLDCLTKGRLIAGVARGIPREYQFFNVAMAESRARFNECFEIMKRAWTEDQFSYEGQFHSYKDVSIWPRPLQQPYPPVWVPITGSKESIEWAAKNDIAITPSSWLALEGRELQDAIVRHYAQCQAKAGRKITPEHLSIQMSCYVADSKAQAIEECGPYFCYLFNTLVPFDQPPPEKVRAEGFNASPQDDLRGARGWGGSGSAGAVSARPPLFGNATMDMLRARADELPWGTPDEVCAHIIREVDHVGAGTVILMCNPGAMPKDMFLNQVWRIGKDVLPRLQAHKVMRVKLSEGIGV